jgi:hypothetical protein
MILSLLLGRDGNGPWVWHVVSNRGMLEECLVIAVRYCE